MNLNFKFIEDSLMQKHPQLICEALTDSSKRDEIKQIIMKDYSIAKDETVAEKITSEIVGTGIIEEIISEYEDVTDIKYDGNRLAVAGVTHFKVIEDEKVTEEYVQRLIQKFAAAMGKDPLSRKHPRLNGVLGHIRLSAMHHSNTTGGTTFSMRIVRPKLALNKQNFEYFAPEFMLDFAKAAVDVYSNHLIAGRTGTGKTEFQKLLLSFTRGEKDEMGVIQDVPELFAKALNPNKIIYEWLTGNGLSHDDLIEDAMRNNFRWIIVSEIRDKAAYALYQAGFSGHSYITTLHAKDSLAIPKRFAQLATFSPQAANTSVDILINDIIECTDFGWHIEKETYNQRDYRFLHETAAYDDVEGSQVIFKQYIENGHLNWETGTLPDNFKTKLKRKGIDLNFPENSNGSIKLHENEVVMV